MVTNKMKAYLRNIAAEHIDGGYEDDERDYSEERDEIWDQMSQEEKDLANDLAIGIFGHWIGV